MKVVKIIVPPDKSISQRAIMLASISEGTTRIKNLLLGDDCLKAVEAFRAMGVKIWLKHMHAVVLGVGMRGLKKPNRPLYLGNSGTMMRILPGILAGQDFEAILQGDDSLSKRPMKRIVEPLRKMGAEVEGSRQKDIYPPLKIHGTKLRGIKYKSKIASAQVKSCILLAGLYADGTTSVVEPVKSRDHTERMLKMFGCGLKTQGCRVSLKGPVKLKSPGLVEIPGDISSAAFFIAAGCILPNIKIVLKNIGLNPTRTGVLDILKRMGADIKVTRSPGHQVTRSEPVGDVIVRTSSLKGVSISSKDVIRAIDEIPIIMVAACFAHGKTVIRGIGELRVKETDRVRSMMTNLKKIGVDIRLGKVAGQGQTLPRAIIINGGRQLHGAKVSSFGDHRTAMSMLIAGLAVKGLRVDGLDCINKSFPGFERVLCSLNDIEARLRAEVRA